MVALGRLRPSDPMTEGMVHKTGREAQGKTNLGFIPESSFSDALTGRKIKYKFGLETIVFCKILPGPNSMEQYYCRVIRKLM